MTKISGSANYNHFTIVEKSVTTHPPKEEASYLNFDTKKPLHEPESNQICSESAVISIHARPVHLLGKFTNPDSAHISIHVKPPCQPETIYSGFRGSDGKLVLQTNSTRDQTKPTDVIFELPPPPGMTNNQFMDKIKEAAEAYQKGVIHNPNYSFPSVSLIPGASDGKMRKDECNSNSLAAYLLTQAGGTRPDIGEVLQEGFQAPGWDSNFEKCD